MYQEWFEKYKKITNESKADEMFEELGYEKQQEEIQNEIDNVICQKRYEKNGFEFLKKIEINNPKIYSYPFIRAIKIFILVEKYDEVDISMEELKAINEKVKELGWLDEK